MEPQWEVYKWTGCLREWVSAPPIWLGATLQQEKAYLLHSKLQHLSAERSDDEMMYILLAPRWLPQVEG
ncbi:hypothetical protein D1007_36196 [Hordeum vulgare]|nr:hypothetical protein D1007_36196 [Hordeum vulgare]